MAEVKSDLSAEIAAVRSDPREIESRLQKDIQQVRYDLLKWQIGIAIVIIIIMAKGFGWPGF